MSLKTGTIASEVGKLLFETGTIALQIETIALQTGKLLFQPETIALQVGTIPFLRNATRTESFANALKVEKLLFQVGTIVL